MPRRATLLAAAGVIVVGLAGAMLFRREPAAAPPSAVPAEDEVLVRRRPAMAQGDLASSPHPTSQTVMQADVPSAANWPALPTASAVPEGVNPHSVAARHNPFAVQARQPPSSPASFTPPPAAPTAPVVQGAFAATPMATPERTHIVIDGDTLSDLAELYLGSSRRYPEIFEANRDILQHPDLLPIGARLRIPGGKGPVAQSTATEQDLVPIPHNAWRRGRGERP